MALRANLYTGAMAADLSELENEQIGITAARRNLAELVNRVRLLGEHKSLMSRDRRMAVVVPVEWYDCSVRLDALVRRLKERDPDLLAELLRETRGTTS